MPNHPQVELIFRVFRVFQRSRGRDQAHNPLGLVSQCFFSPFNPGQISLTPLHSRQQSRPSRIAKFLLDQILPVIHSEIFNLQHFATPLGLITFTPSPLERKSQVLCQKGKESHLPQRNPSKDEAISKPSKRGPFSFGFKTSSIRLKTRSPFSWCVGTRG